MTICAVIFRHIRAELRAELPITFLWEGCLKMIISFFLFNSLQGYPDGTELIGGHLFPHILVRCGEMESHPRSCCYPPIPYTTDSMPTLVAWFFLHNREDLSFDHATLTGEQFLERLRGIVCICREWGVMHDPFLNHLSVWYRLLNTPLKIHHRMSSCSNIK